ncbi:MAG TPA: glycoside hydrolase family 43 protein [Prolixibacteraceae bacterium]|nr:glycoside hydrolase family 43 protein [Prolixibacteraceae bacterium]
MRYLLLLLVFMTFQSQGQEQVYLFSYFTDNGQDGLHLAYSHDGLKWEALKEGKSMVAPTVGNDKLMRDPFILQGKDGLFHMVWTSSWKEKQIGYASSKDLINWSEQKAIPVMDHELTAKNCWAPEMVYDPQNKNYIIFWATTIPGRHTDVASSESEKGLNHRMYSTTTSDFQDFSPTKIFFNPNFSVIDATILPKGNTFYMFLKNENSNPPEKNIRLTKSKHASGPYPTEVSAPITGKYWAEGPTALEVGDYVYVYFDKYTEHKYGAVRSKNLKDWEDVSDKVTFPDGVRHGTAFKVSSELFKNLIQLK